MRLALYQPDIPQNAGAALRLAACLGVGVDIIEPCGFVWSEPKMRRAGMDYLDNVDLKRHSGWAAYRAQTTGRIVLLTTGSAERFDNFLFSPDDTLLLGRESAGVPADVHAAADARLCIPMMPGMRSLNVVNAAAIVLGEGLRQTKGFPS
ncbi:tRNA (cytidine(34)-2'-O)-methyltransferase [Hwanghaeella grinnelliae]|uniref:tRNA (cytidine(34)-2'-O)-methyltransferase n=1 Tax=Hwanghaeella grinnelliae TaxID=2500179 RepID=A0A437QN60_9PROT|nr:tRNA (cytidine(34)-2'-O)-methyltransferase [Hwanghaeella grinnelliae]RVU35880.1 tRNA (cytidine(34)-2'-O)-methyltransferase [Hwanghaeella grinnelliae]